MNSLSNASVLLIRFRLSKDTEDLNKLSSIGVPKEQIHEATINDFLTGGVSHGFNLVILKLDECNHFDWDQLFNLLETTFKKRLPVLVCYDRDRQYHDIIELTAHYTHILLFGIDGALEDLKRGVTRLVDNPDIEWNNEETGIDENAGDRCKKESEQLLGYLTHEMKTPLSAVIGYTEDLMEKDNLDEQTRRSLKKIYSNSYQLLHVMNSVLEFPDHFLKEQDGEVESFRLDELIDEVVDWQKRETDKSDLAIEHNVSASLKHEILGNEGLLRQISINMLKNAIEHTREGRVEVNAEPVDRNKIHMVKETVDYTAVDLLERSKQKQFFKLEVRDQGSGIDRDTMERIFELGVTDKTDDNAASLPIAHTGIGLSVVKQLVEQMNGLLAIRSDADRDTSFIAVIPYEKTEENNQQMDYETVEPTPDEEFYMQMAHEAHLMGSQWVQEFHTAIEGLDLNKIVLLCDRQVDDKPSLKQVFEAAVFKNFRFLVEVQTAIILEDSLKKLNGIGKAKASKKMSKQWEQENVVPLHSADKLGANGNGNGHADKRKKVAVTKSEMKGGAKKIVANYN